MICSMVCFLGFVRIFFKVYLFSLFACSFIRFFCSCCLLACLCCTRCYTLCVICFCFCLFCFVLFFVFCLFGDFSDLLGFNRAIFEN
jgi:hypothetical protein